MRRDSRGTVEAFRASGLSQRAFSKATGVPQATLWGWLQADLLEPLPTHCERCGEQFWVEVATLTGVQWEECRCGARPVPLRRRE